MSYTRNYQVTLRGSTSGTVDYPASERGGSTRVTLPWSEDVSVRIVVEDQPFERGVDSVKNHVDVLTAAVVATEAAQLLSKKAAADKVADCVVGGFFKLIQGELSQQMMELDGFLTPKLQELNGTAKRCVDLQKQMQQDFHRISGRYVRLFSELDNELRLRIQNLDRAVFDLCKKSALFEKGDAQAKRLTVSLVAGKESLEASVLLSSHTLRQRALAVIQSMCACLEESEKLKNDMKAILDDWQGEEGTLHVPLLIVEKNEFMGGRSTELIGPRSAPFFAVLDRERGTILNHETIRARWRPMSSSMKERLNERLTRLMAENLGRGANAATTRKLATMQDLWRRMTIQTLSEGELP